jgi:RNA polymerase sigma factor (sigma-70 family)
LYVGPLCNYIKKETILFVIRDKEELKKYNAKKRCIRGLGKVFEDFNIREGSIVKLYLSKNKNNFKLRLSIGEEKKEKTDYKDLTDREIIVQLKKEESEAKTKKLQETLYYRYIPMITKYAFKSRKISDSIEDFKQEAFFAMIEAIKYCDTKKIKNNKWKFLGIFWFYIQKLILQNFKNSHQNAEFNETFYKDHVSFTPLDSFIINDIKDQFLETLTGLQLKILQGRREGLTIQEIADKRGVSYGTIFRQIYFAARKASEVFGFDYKYKDKNI